MEEKRTPEVLAAEARETEEDVDQLKILVEETIKHNSGQDKQLRVMKALLVLLMILVLVLGYFSFSLSRDVTNLCNTINNTLSPEQVETLVDAIDTLQQKIGDLDMVSLNDKLSELDIDQLNSALAGLTDAANKISAVGDKLSGFSSSGLLGGLLG